MITSYSRNEIAQRSRKRQKIRREEAQALGVVSKKIMISTEHLDEIEKAGWDLDMLVNRFLITEIRDELGVETKTLPLEEIKENAFIRQQREGL